MLSTAQKAWALALKTDSTVIDATCGNGHDTLFLAQLMNGSGHLSAYDIQLQAIHSTEALLTNSLPPAQRQNITLKHTSHEQFEETTADLIVYNLGYLPRSDKCVKTNEITTLTSLKHACQILNNQGLISIMCYPGHPEGECEEKALLAYFATLCPKTWKVSHQVWLNRHKAPSLILAWRQ